MKLKLFILSQLILLLCSCNSLNGPDVNSQCYQHRQALNAIITANANAHAQMLSKGITP